MSILPGWLIAGRTVHLSCEAESDDDSSPVDYTWRLPGTEVLAHGQQLDWTIPEGLDRGRHELYCTATNAHGCSTGHKVLKVWAKNDEAFGVHAAEYSSGERVDVAPTIDRFSCEQTTLDRRSHGTTCHFQASDTGGDTVIATWDVDFGQVMSIREGEGDDRYAYALPPFILRPRRVHLRVNATDLRHEVLSPPVELVVEPRACQINGQAGDDVSTLQPSFSNESPLRISRTIRWNRSKDIISPGPRYFSGKWDTTEGALACQRRIARCALRSAPPDWDGCVLGALRCKSSAPVDGDPAGDDCCPDACVEEYFRLRTMRSLCHEPRTLLAHVLLSTGCYPGTPTRCIPLEIP